MLPFISCFSGECFCEGTLKGDGRGFKMLYILADAKSFADDAEVDFGSVVRRDGSGWIRLAEQVPEVSHQ
jgi:hypothetical protein